MNERKLIDEIKLAVQQDAIAGYWNGRVFVSDDKKTYTNIISNSQPIGVGFIVKHGDKWLLVVGSSNSEGRKNIINSKRSRPTIDNPQYPVITLFGNVIIANNNQILGIGGNQPKKQLRFSGNPLEVRTSSITGYIANNGRNKYSVFYRNILPNGSREIVAIVNNIKSIITLSNFNGLYIGDNVWIDGRSKVIRNCVLEDYSSQMVEVYYPPVLANYPAPRKSFLTWHTKFFGDGGFCEHKYEQTSTAWDEVISEDSEGGTFIRRFAKETYRRTVLGTAVILRFKDCIITQQLGFTVDDETYGRGSGSTEYAWNNTLRTITQNRISIASTTINTDLNTTPLRMTVNLDMPLIDDVIHPANADIGTTFSFKSLGFNTLSINSRNLNITTTVPSPIPVMMAKEINNIIYLIKAQATFSNTVKNDYVDYDYFRKESVTNQIIDTTVTMVITESRKILSIPSFGLNQVMPDTGSFYVFHKCITEYYDGYGSVLNYSDDDIEGYSQTFPLNFQFSFDQILKKLNFVKDKFYFVLRDRNYQDDGADFTMEHTGKFVEIWKLFPNGDIRFETIKKFDSYPDTYKETESTSYRFHSASYYPI